MLKKLKNNYFLLISTFFIFYFFFNFMSGQRGFVSYLEKKKILKDLQLKEASLINWSFFSIYEKRPLPPDNKLITKYKIKKNETIMK